MKTTLKEVFMMKLCKVKGKRLVHKVIKLPPIKNQFISATGREGVACGTDFGFLFFVEKFDGKKKDITCKACLAQA